MADLRTLTVAPHGRPIDVIVDFDELRAHKPDDLIDNTPDFMAWVHAWVKETVLRTIPAPPPPPQHVRRESFDPQVARIRRLERDGKLCRGEVIPSRENDGGKCGVLAVERIGADGEPLGRYCIRHFRTLFPEIETARRVAEMHAGESSKERAAIAYRLRTREKLSFDEIGARLGGVSRERARQLVGRGEHNEHRRSFLEARAERESAEARARASTDVTLAGLSQRTRNCLQRGLGRTRDDLSPAEIVAMSDDDLLSLRNFGEASLREVRAAFGPHDPAAGGAGNWVGEGVIA